MRRIVMCFSVVAILAMASSCRSQKLTRDSAQEILGKIGAQRQVGQLTVSIDQLTALTHLEPQAIDKVNEILNFNQGKPCVPDASDVRIAGGQFVLCQGYAPPEVTWQRPGVVLKLTKPIGWKVVEVTGISDDPHASTDKIVEYTWRYDLTDFPNGVEDILNPKPSPTGKAAFRLYDDGWRFVEFR